MRTSLLISFFLINLNFLLAQEMGSKSFDLVIKQMLNHSIPEISIDEASINKTAIFLDARAKKEYLVSHINSAHWIGFDTINWETTKDFKLEQEIIVYCSIGYRSEKVAEQLKEKGFQNVKNLYGGIFEWKNKGNPVFKSDSTPTEEVHAYNKVWGIWLKNATKIYD